MLFDQPFGTYHNPAVEAPRILGIKGYVPFRQLPVLSDRKDLPASGIGGIFQPI